MRSLLIMILLLLPALALADEGDGDHEGHRSSERAPCPSPQCHCNDTTTTTGCLDAAGCAKFCEDHDGALKMHRRHPRHGHSEDLDAADSENPT